MADRSMPGSAVDIGRVSDFVKGVQDQNRAQNERAIKSVEHAVLAGLAYSAYKRYRRR